MFGLGMNNNGAALVLAATALAHHPSVLVPIIMYNLMQHLFAGGVDIFITRTPLPSNTLEQKGTIGEFEPNTAPHQNVSVLPRIAMEM
jgi:hypothetical protein